MDDFEKRYQPRYENQPYPIPGAFTIDEFWEHERASELRYEFINGTMIERNGESINHSGMTVNILAFLMGHTRSHNMPHKPFMTGLRVRVHAQCYVYPDVFVTDGNLQTEKYGRDESAINPLLIVEILSPLSEPFDKIHKFEAYQTIPSLQDYLIASQDRIWVTHHHRIGAAWTHYESKTYIQPDDTIALLSLGCQLPLREVYEKTDFDPEWPYRTVYVE